MQSQCTYAAAGAVDNGGDEFGCLDCSSLNASAAGGGATTTTIFTIATKQLNINNYINKLINKYDSFYTLIGAKTKFEHSGYPHWNF